MACRLAAERAPAVGSAGVDAALARMRAGALADDREAVKAADFDFHVAVVELAGHARLREHYRLLHTQTRLFLNLTASADYPLREIADVHAELAAAIRTGDAGRAERLGGEHNTADGEAICARLEPKGDSPL
jgi:DNA-binding GntR family transcriptional regulator